MIFKITLFPNQFTRNKIEHSVLFSHCRIHPYDNEQLFSKVLMALQRHNLPPNIREKNVLFTLSIDDNGNYTWDLYARVAVAVACKWERIGLLKKLTKI